MVVILLNHLFFPIINVDTLRRGLRGELAAMQVVPAVTSYIFHIPSYINNSRRFVVAAKVEAEGANVGLAAVVIAQIHMEVRAEGVHRPAVGAGIIELVVSAKIVSTFAGSERNGVEVADEADFTVGAFNCFGIVSFDFGVCELWVHDGAAVVRPLYEIGHAGFDGCGVLEVEIERAVVEASLVVAICIAIGAVDIEFHDGGIVERMVFNGYLSGGDIEGQTERVPIAILIERATTDGNIGNAAVVLIYRRSVRRVVSAVVECDGVGINDCRDGDVCTRHSQSVGAVAIASERTAVNLYDIDFLVALGREGDLRRAASIKFVTIKQSGSRRFVALVEAVCHDAVVVALMMVQRYEFIWK